MKYYLSGNMTNGGTTEPSFDHFFEAEKKLTGTILNPARWEERADKPWEWYLARDLQVIADELPTMYMLKGWEKSLGARLEHEWALVLGLDIEYED